MKKRRNNLKEKWVNSTSRFVIDLSLLGIYAAYLLTRDKVKEGVFNFLTKRGNA